MSYYLLKLGLSYKDEEGDCLSGNIIVREDSLQDARKNMMVLFDEDYRHLNDFKVIRDKVEFGIHTLRNNHDDHQSLDADSFYIVVRSFVFKDVDEMESFESDMKKLSWEHVL